MKRLLLSLLFLFLIVVSSSARMTPIICGGQIAEEVATVYCASCPDNTNGGEYLCEVWDSSADGVCAWSISETNCSIDTATSPATALGCTNIQSDYVFDFTKSVATAGNCYTTKDHGSNITSGKIYLQLYVQVVSEDLSDGEEQLIYQLATNSNGTSQWNVRFFQNSGSVYLGASWHSGASWYSSTSSAAISTGQWYGVRVQVDLDASPDTMSWWIDYNNNGTWTAQTGQSGDADRSMRYHLLGVASASKVSHFQVAGLKISNSAMPTSCDR